MKDLIGQIIEFYGIFGGLWYIWLPVGLFFILRDAWLGYARGYFLSNLKWILLEIKIPREVAKSPKAMESIFASFFGATKASNLVEKYWDGYLNPWFSLEIIGNESGVHFYVWTQDSFRRMVESQIYAQYPTCEIAEVDDYTQALPKDIPNDDWTLWGTEMVLTKPDAYPIRTYEDFTLEDISEKEELRKIDPLSALIEFFGSLKNGEHCWVQFNVRPSGEKWKKEGEALIAKIMGREIKPKETILGQVLRTIDSLLSAIFSASAPPSPQKKDDFSIFKLSPGQQEIIKSVERNIAKIGFDVGLRWMYLARKDVFSGVGISALFGIFKQFSSQALNGFRPHGKTMTKSGYFQYIAPLKNRIEGRRRRRLYQSYRMRSFFYPPYTLVRPFVLSSSELATLYHFPGIVAGAPAMTRIEAKKSSAPSNLPI